MFDFTGRHGCIFRISPVDTSILAILRISRGASRPGQKKKTIALMQTIKQTKFKATICFDISAVNFF